jgi:hypothetical protein
MTESKKIVVWGRDDILSSSIEFFLGTQADWKVVSVGSDQDVDDLLQAVETVKPDIVVINKTCPNDLSDLAMELLLAHSPITLITINLDNNAMEVYSKQRIMVKQASDLIVAIEQSLSGRPASFGL